MTPTRCSGEAGSMLYLIGLGLGDATDITVKGLQAVRSCSRIYLEAYTSILTVGKEALVSRSTLTDTTLSDVTDVHRYI